MKSKKIISLLLVATLTLGMGAMLSGCGDKSKGTEVPQKLEEVAGDVTEAVDQTEKSEESIDPVRQQEVVDKAKKVSELLPKSKMGLSGYLTEFEGLTSDEAVYAVNNCGVDWKEEAIEYVYYIMGANPDMTSEDMRGQLEYEGFTAEEIEYAIKNVY